MAARGDSEGFVSTPLEDKGIALKTLIFLSATTMRLHWKRQRQNTRVKSLIIIDDKEIFLGVNPPEVHLQFNIGQTDALITFPNSK